MRHTYRSPCKSNITSCSTYLSLCVDIGVVRGVFAEVIGIIDCILLLFVGSGAEWCGVVRRLYGSSYGDVCISVTTHDP